MALRKQLEVQQLIIPSPLGALFFKQKKVKVIGYPTHDIELSNALKPHVLLCDFESTQPTIQPHLSLHVFVDTEAEVRYGLNAIAHELHSGRPIESIHIMRPSAEYIEPLKRLSKHYRMPIDFEEATPWIQTPIGIALIRALEDHLSDASIQERLSHFPDAHRLPIQALLDTVKALPLSPSERIAWLAHQLQTSAVESPPLTKAVRVKTSYVPTDQWVWVLGFNQPHWPITERDDDTISDQLKADLGRLTSKDNNRFEQNRSLQFLSASPNILVTYKRFHLGQAFQPSSLIYDCVIDATHDNPLFPIDYGRDQALITRELLKEKKKIYRIEDAYLSSYMNQVTTPIEPFNYAFKPWNHGFNESWNKISYSKLSDFYKCQFKYYVNKYLQLDTQDDMFYANLGTLMHNIFEKTQASAEQFETIYSSEYEKLKAKFAPRKQLIVEGLKQDMKKVVLFNLKHRSHMKLTNMVAEQEVKFSLNDTMGFSGKIDKIVVTSDGEKQYVSLIDYKTGKESFVEDEIEIGWSLQLPIYAWLLSKHPDFKTYQLIGLYIQHVLDDSLLTKEGQDEDEQLEKILKLDGVANEHMGPLSTFDPTFKNSEFIRSVKVIKNGTFGKKAKVRTNEQFESYRTIAEQKVLEAVEKIQHGDFRINPIRFRKKNSCTHCPFQDVCFRKDKDVQYVELKKDRTDESKPNS
jgi:CRISPR/Cas system-associated exonuclease Cas4 (RecB family)